MLPAVEQQSGYKFKIGKNYIERLLALKMCKTNSSRSRIPNTKSLTFLVEFLIL